MRYTTSLLERIPKTLLTVIITGMAFISIGMPEYVFSTIQKQPLSLMLWSIPHWLFVMLWTYLKQDGELERFVNGINFLRYACLLYGSAISFLSLLLSETKEIYSIILGPLFYIAACIFPQIVFKVKEDCYPLHKKWVTTAICGIVGTTLLSIILHMLFNDIC